MRLPRPDRSGLAMTGAQPACGEKGNMNTNEKKLAVERARKRLIKAQNDFHLKQSKLPWLVKLDMMGEMLDMVATLKKAKRDKGM